MNQIYGKQIINSIEMKDKWLNSILKKSRKLSSLDKFWNLVIEELGYTHIQDLRRFEFFISEFFLEELKSSDINFNNKEDYSKHSPRTYCNIDEEDYSIYIIER